MWAGETQWEGACVAARGLKALMNAQGESGAWKINLIISGLLGAQHKSSRQRCFVFFTRAIVEFNNTAS